MVVKAKITSLDFLIGLKAKELREQSDITQSGLAKIFSTHNGMISMLENGKRAWSSTWIEKYCAYFDVLPKEMYDKTIKSAPDAQSKSTLSSDDIAKRIRVVLEHRGISQSVLARDASIQPGYLSEVLNGVKRLNTDTIDKILSSLNLTIGQLFDNTLFEIKSKHVLGKKGRKPNIEKKNAIFHIRKMHGWSAAELAERINTSTQNVQRWESGEVDLPMSRVYQLADALKCSVGEILGLEMDIKKIDDVLPTNFSKQYEHIKNEMKAQGKNQRQLAELINKTQPVASNLFSGRRNLDTSEIKIIATWLGKSEEFVLYGVDTDKLNEEEKRLMAEYRKLEQIDKKTVENVVQALGLKKASE